MIKNIVWQLLRRNISVGQLAGYAVANLVGLAIVLTAVQFTEMLRRPEIRRIRLFRAIILSYPRR